jgi:soluble lytic murein transglycosylase
LLSAERIGADLDSSLAGTPLPDWRGSAVLDNELVQAGLFLLDLDERGAAVLFFAQLGRELPQDQIEQLGAMMGDRGEPYFQLLLGKSAAERGMIIPALYFPDHPLADKDIPVPHELALSIARRESEFRVDAGSPVGALGLMQLMPATAREVAGNLDLPYSRGQLTNDWDYNATLGSQYLADLQGEFGYSPVMMAAGYNAGPSRPKRWMDERGDPRLGEVDVVDWIEHIPFRETRNYVMRVTETMPIYQARLSGQTGPIRFTELLIGEKPAIRPRARPVALNGLTSSLRPLARPD